MIVLVGFAIAMTAWTFALLPIFEPRDSGGFALHVVSLNVGLVGAIVYGLVFGYGVVRKRLSVDWIIRGAMSLVMLILTVTWLSVR